MGLSSVLLRTEHRHGSSHSDEEVWTPDLALPWAFRGEPAAVMAAPHPQIDPGRLDQLSGGAPEARNGAVGWPQKNCPPGSPAWRSCRCRGPGVKLCAHGTMLTAWLVVWQMEWPLHPVVPAQNRLLHNTGSKGEGRGWLRHPADIHISLQNCHGRSVGGLRRINKQMERSADSNFTPTMDFSYFDIRPAVIVPKAWKAILGKDKQILLLLPTVAMARRRARHRGWHTPLKPGDFSRLAIGMAVTTLGRPFN
jgi:hypothetical protein